MNHKAVILVPTDFTPVGDSAVRYAVELSKILKSEIHLLHIVAKDKEIVQAKAVIDNIVNSLAKENIVAHSLVEVGSIFDDIGKVAERLNAKLIVMGTHGVKGMQHIMGSKALKVITNSDVPFVVVQKTPMREHGFKHIVLPIDFNQEVKQGMIYASEMAKYFNSKIHIVYPLEKDEFILAKITRNIPHAEEYLQEQGIDYEITGIEKNDFAKDLIAFAQQNHADLITLINNHENIFTYFGGSFEQTVIGNNAEVPVMVINHIALKTAYGFSIYFG
jgi:nucleotide-binding universal stress UspA family protein